MTAMRVLRGIALSLIGGLAAFPAASAQSVGCDQVGAIATLARARSLEEIHQIEGRAGGSFTAQVVSAFRTFQLQPNVQNAEHLLNIVPKDQSQVVDVMTLGDSLCDRESVADMLTLGQVGEQLPTQFARAVLAAPNLMPVYVRYGLKAIRDPHNDYAVQMQKVCQKEHQRFAGAVAALPADEHMQFTQHVMKVEGCEILALPEAN